MSGDLLGSPKPKEMAVGGLAGRWPWRGGGAREAEAQALVPHHWRGGGGGAWCRRGSGAGRRWQRCKENGPKAHLLWILVFDDQHNQVRLMNLQVIIL